MSVSSITPMPTLASMLIPPTPANAHATAPPDAVSSTVVDTALRDTRHPSIQHYAHFPDTETRTTAISDVP